MVFTTKMAASVRFPIYKIEDSVAIVKVKKRSYPKGGQANPFEVLGTAIVLTEDGYLLTTNGLIGEATNAEIFFENGAHFKATVVGRDLRTDLAVLKIDCKNLKPISWSNYYQKGEEVAVVGAVYEPHLVILHSVLAGGLKKNHLFEPTKSYAGNAFEYFCSDVLQYSVNIAGTRMNSAAIFDQEGGCMGINTQLFNQFGLDGFAFAIPGATAAKVAYEIINHGKVVRKQIGVLLQEIDQKLFVGHKLDRLNSECSQNYGALITDFRPNSTAQKYGLKSQDIVVSVNGIAIKNVENLQNMILMNSENSVKIVIWRKILGTETGTETAKKIAQNPKEDKKLEQKNLDKIGEKNPIEKKIDPKIPGKILKTIEDYQLLEFVVPLSQLPDSFVEKTVVNESKMVKIQLLTLTKDDKLLHTLSNTDEKFDYGLFVSKVFDKKLASILRGNDVILKVQGKEMRNLGDFDSAITESLKKNEKYIILLVVRNGQVYSYAVELNEIEIKEGKKCLK